MTNQTPPKTRIKQELLSQLEQRPYKKITMKSLAESLGMTRANLYKHYSSKDEIILAIIQEHLDLVFDLFESMELELDAVDWQALLRQSAQVLLINKEMVCAVMASDVEALAFEYVNSFVTRVLGHIARVNEIQVKDQVYFKLLVLQISGAGFNVVKGWAISDMLTPADQVAALLDGVVNESMIDRLRLCEMEATT